MIRLMAYSPCSCESTERNRKGYRAAIECEHCGKLYHESELKAYVDKDKADIARTAAIIVSESKRKQLSRVFKK